MTPAISVLMSVYNGARYLEESIDSIRTQSFRDYEFIIIDDASTDSSPEIIDRFQKKDARIIVLHNSKNLGLTKSLNLGLTQCHGMYIARMDADDVSTRDRFRRQFELMEAHVELALCGTHGWYIDDHGNKLGEKNVLLSYEEIKKKILYNNQFIHSSLFIRKEVLEKEGYYDETFKTSQDYELVLRIVAKYRVMNLPDYLVSWRVTKNSRSWVNKRQEYDAIRARLKAIMRYKYSKMAGFLHIFLRCMWILVPQNFKIRRYL